MIRGHAYRRIAHVALFLMVFLPQTAPESVRALENTDLPSLELFVQAVMNGDPDEVRGLYVPGLLADTVVAQPEGMPAYVSPEQGALTRFEMAEEYGTHGLLAHNYLAGEAFDDLGKGQNIFLVYGDGRIGVFAVAKFYRYQALSPRSVTSDFIDLETQERLSASELFVHAFNRPGHVVLQTCIYADGDPSWGRLFVIAAPIGVFDPRSMPGYIVFQ
jgi:hypothetical protein